MLEVRKKKDPSIAQVRFREHVHATDKRHSRDTIALDGLFSLTGVEGKHGIEHSCFHAREENTTLTSPDHDGRIRFGSEGIGREGRHESNVWASQII